MNSTTRQLDIMRDMWATVEIEDFQMLGGADAVHHTSAAVLSKNSIQNSKFFIFLFYTVLIRLESEDKLTSKLRSIVSGPK